MPREKGTAGRQRQFVKGPGALSGPGESVGWEGVAGKNYGESSETHAFNSCKMNANPKLFKKRKLFREQREKKFKKVLNLVSDDH